MKVRKLETKDKARWRNLWDEYCLFYQVESTDTKANYLWKRIMDVTVPVHSIVAVDDNDRVIGIANFLTHENTSTNTPVCYLQDLFVDSELRGNGIGRALIDYLVAEMKSNNWSKLYWNTKEDNHVARKLYDSYTFHSGFVKYSIANEEI